MRVPILFQAGAEHRELRKKTACFFTPATTDREYRDFMEADADEFVEELKTTGRADVSELSMKLAVRVAAKVVGLTDSRRPGMARRIEAVFDQGEENSRFGRFLDEIKSQWRVGALIDFNIYGTNADSAAVGDSPLSLCPERERSRGVQPYVMSFGDGHHRCPGAFIAIQETDIFVIRLLPLDGLEVGRTPTLLAMSWSKATRSGGSRCS